jgi:hypothetical protein
MADKSKKERRVMISKNCNSAAGGNQNPVIRCAGLNPYLYLRRERGDMRHATKCLQLLVNVVGRGNLQNVLSGLLGSVGDLAVVEDDGVAVGAALVVGPADALGESGLGVGEEEL